MFYPHRVICEKCGIVFGLPIGTHRRPSSIGYDIPYIVVYYTNSSDIRGGKSERGSTEVKTPSDSVQSYGYSNDFARKVSKLLTVPIISSYYQDQFKK